MKRILSSARGLLTLATAVSLASGVPFAQSLTGPRESQATLPDFKRRLDLEQGRMGVDLTCRPAFPAVFDNQRQSTRLDDDVALNAPRAAAAGRGGPAGPPARASEQVTRDRRLEMLHHPLTAAWTGLGSSATN